MTHEQFITLETSRLAKQAGFDWECWAYWLSDYANGESEQKAPFENRAVPYDYNTEPGARYKKGNMYSAPTQSVLQRWLREVKNIWVSVTCDTAGDLRYAMYRATLYDEKIGYYHTSYWDDDEKEEYAEEYPTYEAALEAGLQECLTLLIEKQ